MQGAVRKNATSEVVSNDLDAYWMPFTANRRFKANPRLLASASGMHYRTPEGREILDGTAGLWCVNAGHDRPKIREAIQKQAHPLACAAGLATLETYQEEDLFARAAGP